MGAPSPENVSAASPRFQRYDEALRERLQLLSYAFYSCHAGPTASIDAAEAEGDPVEGYPFELDRQHLELLDPPTRQPFTRSSTSTATST